MGGAFISPANQNLNRTTIANRWWTTGDQTMFNVKRNGSNVEITDIPTSIPFTVFKNIADETGANECLVAYAKGKDSYEVVIWHDSVNMAGAAAWLALESREPVTGDADISTIGKRIGVMRVKQHMSAQELEEAISAPEGSVFRWEIGKAEPSSRYINALAAVLKCESEWLLHGNSTNAITEKESCAEEIKGIFGGTPENPKPFSTMYVYDDLIKISGGIPLSYLKELNDNLPKLLDKSVFDGVSNGVFSVSEFGAGMKVAEWRFSSERAAREVGDMITDYPDSDKYEMRARFILPATTDYDRWVLCGIPGGLIKA
ncbi:helix-turn-helix domain-containing protein [Salmonella enterica]|nr:helix-turn-helix domain-containing protein [Salmonella enterica]ECZ7902237.1 helix-turn-helix domain-containing protein [Salmonella enterica subsp. enterica serovar Muenchen]EDB7759241.1 helix-turn-helix domain-containing protein [Salmonella enterica subsp. enterica serovar Urbana]EEK7224422.1 helix-turn-helix domain-containing protein [Salmonella enterica subsp. enterica serovar Muenchen]MII86682.1 helix-turn-helix domain-containing protein [Salmonella enterica subsp. enterica serovar Pomon